MNDEDLISGFFCTAVTADSILIYVKEITWDGPHSSKSRWSEAATLPAIATEQEIAAKIQSLLTDKRFFKVCCDCQGRYPAGQTISVWCHACAETRQGFIF